MSFLYPYVLYALLAVIIPIVIHLFNFRRYQKVWFNNVALLKSIQKKTKKQSQLKHLLVLLMRILTIISLVLAFSGPYLPNKDSSEDPQETEYVSIYLDNSFSMTHLGENGSLLNEAQNMALSILDSYQNKDRFHLITNQMEAKHFRWFNKMEMTQNIMELEAVHLQQDLSAIFQREKMLRLQEEAAIENATLYLLSDFQRNTSFNSNLDPDSTLKVRLLPLQNNPVNNLSIDSVYFHDPVQLPNRESTISAVLSNNGEEKQNAIPLKLIVDNEQKAVLSVDLDAGETKSFEISFTNNASGKKIAQLQIEDYPIVYDDRLYFTFNVRKEFNVAIISAENTNPYLRKLYEEDSLVNLNTYSQNSVNYTELNQQDLLVVDELQTLSSGLQNELKNYLEKGGHLLLIPAENFESNSWLNSLSCPTYSNLIIRPTRMGEIDKENGFFNRIFENQWASESKNQKIDLPQIKAFYSFNSTSNSISLLKTSGELDILLSTSVGMGKVYQLAFPLKTRFSELPEHALFVAIFYQMILQSDDQSRLYETLGSAKPIAIKSADISLLSRGDRVLEFKMGEEIWIPQMTINRASEIILSQIFWPSDGIASLQHDEILIDQFAVNYDRKESDFSVWNKDDLSNLIAENKWPGFQIIESSPDKITAQLIELNEAKRLWKWFLILGIFFIFVETMILRFWK